MTRVKTPLLLQIEAVECGAAALGIVLRYHGCFESLEALRSACNVSRDGTNALNVVRAAQRYGLEAAGLRRSTLSGLRRLNAPFIVYLHGSHFAVYEGMDERFVYLNDPARGHRTLTLAEFEHLYAHIVITAVPGAHFQKRGDAFRLDRALWGWLGGARAALLYILLASVFLLVPAILLPALLRVFVDDVLGSGRGWLGALAIGYLLAFVLRAGLVWLQQAMMLRLETRLATRQAVSFFEHLLQLPLPFFHQRHLGDLIYRVDLHDRLAAFIARDGIDALLNTVLIGVFGLVMLTYSLPLTLVGMAFVVLNLALLRWIGQRRSELNERLLQARAAVVSAAVDGLRSLEGLKAAGSERLLFRRWAGLNAAAISTEQQLGGITARFGSVVPMLLAMNTALVLVLGAALVMQGAMTLGMLVAFQSLMASFTGPVAELAGIGVRMQELRGDLNRIDDIRQQPLAERAQASAVARTAGELAVRDLAFGYNRYEPPLIGPLSFTLTPGSLTVITGASGAGKSTLARLIAGLYEPWAGEVLLDGMPAASMRAHIGYADQSLTLFAGTFRDNLTLWDPFIGQAAIEAAARDACVHDLITARGGYDAPIGENGRDLSGGQRQCLEIARTLTRSPALVILDETTNALDPDTEAQILTHLRWRGCTCLVVAHRVNTARYADRVLHLPLSPEVRA